MLDGKSQRHNILITGANGEIGHALIPALAKSKKNIIALDVKELDKTLKPFVAAFFKKSILDNFALTEIFRRYDISTVYHLAAILSTGAEKHPEQAQLINAQGTSILLEIANRYAKSQKRIIKFIFPSTIAVYGLPDIKTKLKAKKVKENEFLDPLTIYGITKLYCEQLGRYYSKNYSLLSLQHQTFIDFRSLRFPGIISALTVPTGGTSDYASEMIHAAAQGKGYESFVRHDTIIPFMVMPDAVKALLQLTEAPSRNLKQYVYNVSAFSATAIEIAEIVNNAFPNSAISYNPDSNRQKIVDSWPAYIDDSAAKIDWGWKPDYNIERSFKDYLIPEIKNRYSG